MGAIADQMRHDRPGATSWTWHNKSTCCVNLGGYVVMTMTVRAFGIVHKFELTPEVAKRNEPADNALIDDARKAFDAALLTVTRRQLGIWEEG